jgi:hypothetical protein
MNHSLRRFVYAVLALLFASGVLHFVLHDYFPARGPFGPEPNPMEPWLLRLHGAAAMATLFAFGLLTPTHVGRFWRLARNRVPGLALVAVLLLLVVTGYGLYYLGGEQIRVVTRLAHVALGLFALPAFGFHLWRGVASRRPRRGQGAPSSTRRTGLVPELDGRRNDMGLDGASGFE